MMEIIQFLAPALAACVILVGLLSYLGIHVLEREIIFIDIALAQVAAVGYTVGFMIMPEVSHEDPGLALHLLAVGSTVIAAAFFATVSKFICEISHETVIGVTYAITAAATLFLLAMHSGGDIHMEEMLTGSIIWLGWPSICRLALVFAGVGLFHGIFHRRFLQLSSHYACDSGDLGMNKFLWDFLFYASMGVVITQAVNSAGLLLTFSFLIIPGTFSALFARRLSMRLVIAWSVGTAASIAGLGIAYRYDVSTGPAIVSVLGVILCIGALAVWRPGTSTVKNSTPGPEPSP